MSLFLVGVEVWKVSREYAATSDVEVLGGPFCGLFRSDPDASVPRSSATLGLLWSKFCCAGSRGSRAVRNRDAYSYRTSNINPQGSS